MPRDRRATEDMVEVQEELGERGSAPTETWHWRIAADGFSPFVSGDLGGPGAGRVPPKGLRCQAGHLWGFFFSGEGPFWRGKDMWWSYGGQTTFSPPRFLF